MDGLDHAVDLGAHVHGVQRLGAAADGERRVALAGGERHHLHTLGTVEVLACTAVVA